MDADTIMEMGSYVSLQMRVRFCDLSKPIPKLKIEAISAQNRSANVIDAFRATESTLFNEGVEFLHRYELITVKDSFSKIMAV